MAKNIIKEIIVDPKHWIGWFISALLITIALATTMHLMGKHCIHRPFWVVIIAFIVIFVVLTLVDIIKHPLKIQ